MKGKNVCVLVIVLVAVVTSPNIFACVPGFIPFRKEYRKAEGVFVGKVESIVQFEPSKEEKDRLTDENWLLEYEKNFWKVRFSLERSWKGPVTPQQEFVSLIAGSCGCINRRIEAGREYLVLASGKIYIDVCDAREITSNQAKAEVRRLDNIWFRTWATIYPF